MQEKGRRSRVFAHGGTTSWKQNVRPRSELDGNSSALLSLGVTKPRKRNPTRRQPSDVFDWAAPCPSPLEDALRLPTPCGVEGSDSHVWFADVGRDNLLGISEGDILTFAAHRKLGFDIPSPAPERFNTRHPPTATWTIWNPQQPAQCPIG